MADITLTSLTTGTNEDARLLIEIGFDSSDTDLWWGEDEGIGTLTTNDRDLPPVIDRINYGEGGATRLRISREESDTNFSAYVDANPNKSLFILLNDTNDELYLIEYRLDLGSAFRGSIRWDDPVIGTAEAAVFVSQVAGDNVLFVFADAGSVGIASGGGDLMPTLPVIADQNAVVGTPFSVTLSPAAGGDPPLSYFVTGRPSWLAFDSSTRVLSGTPTAAGTTTLTYIVLDDDNDSSSRDFDIVVSAADTTPSAPSIADQSAVVGTAFSVTLDPGTGGNPPLSYAVTGRPAWLSFNAITRVLSGTPTAAGTSSLTYTVTDDDGDSDSDTFDIVVSAAATIGTGGPPLGQPSIWCTVHKAGGDFAGLGAVRLAQCEIERNVNHAVMANASVDPSDQEAKRLLRFGNFVKVYTDQPQRRQIMEGYLTNISYQRSQEDASLSFQAIGLLKELAWRVVEPGSRFLDTPLQLTLRGLLPSNWSIYFSGIPDGLNVYQGTTLGQSLLELIESIASTYNYHFYALGRRLYFGDFSAAPFPQLTFLQAGSALLDLNRHNYVFIESIETNNESYEIVNRIVPYSGPAEAALTLKAATIVGKYTIRSEGEKYFLQDDELVARYGLVERMVKPDHLIYTEEWGQRFNAANLLYEWAETYLEDNSEPERFLNVTARSARPVSNGNLGLTALVIYKPLSETDPEEIREHFNILGITERYGPEGYAVNWELESRRRQHRSLSRLLAEDLRSGKQTSTAIQVTQINAARTYRYAPALTEGVPDHPTLLGTPLLEQSDVWPDDGRIFVRWGVVDNASAGYRVRYEKSDDDNPSYQNVTTGTSVTLTAGIVNDKNYSVSVQALAAGGFTASAFSDVVRARPTAPPSEVPVLEKPAFSQDEITEQDGQLTIETPAVEGARTFSIGYQPDDDFPITTEAVISGIREGDYVLSGLTNGTPYLIRIRADGYSNHLNSSYYTTSEWSLIQTATPIPKTFDLTLPDNLRDIVKVRAVVTRDSLQARQVRLRLGNIPLDLGNFFVSGNYDKEEADLTDGLSDYLVAGETHLFSIELQAGGNGEAYYAESVPIAERKSFEVRFSLNVTVVQDEDPPAGVSDAKELEE